jgi:calcium permeable stress-gated cation channel
VSVATWLFLLLSYSRSQFCYTPRSFLGTAGGFLQILFFVMHYVKKKLFTSTRALCTRSSTLLAHRRGTSLPNDDSAGCDHVWFFRHISYHQQPRGCGLLPVLPHKYLFTWVNDQLRSSDTGGLLPPEAINHIFVGLYVQQVCLCASFFLALLWSLRVYF